MPKKPTEPSQSKNILDMFQKDAKRTSLEQDAKKQRNLELEAAIRSMYQTKPKKAKKLLTTDELQARA